MWGVSPPDVNLSHTADRCFSLGGAWIRGPDRHTAGRKSKPANRFMGATQEKVEKITPSWSPPLVGANVRPARRDRAAGGSAIGFTATPLSGNKRLAHRLSKAPRRRSLRTRAVVLFRRMTCSGS